MSIFVALRKKREHDTTVPYFEICDRPPILEGRDKSITLEDGDCVDACIVSFSNDLTYIIVELYRVSNVDNVAKQELLETFTLPRAGR